MRKLVSLPEGCRVEVTLNEEQIELFVREELRRQVGDSFRNARGLSTVQHFVRKATRQVVKEELQSMSASRELHNTLRELMIEWLYSREGWVARQLRRGVVSQKGGTE